MDSIKLAVFGSGPLFPTVKPTSNFARPDLRTVMEYSRAAFHEKNCTNDGSLIKLLESRLAKFHHTAHCVTFSGCFWALVFAIKAVAVPNKREVIFPSLTYRRMDDIVSWSGFVPHFCDVDEKSLSITPKAIIPCINENTALILAPHPIGGCCPSNEIEQFGVSHGIPTLFDSVECQYEICADRKIGSFSRAECFSLHASKLINGLEGGYVTTNDSELAEKLHSAKHFGLKSQDGSFVGCGINFGSNEIHAAVALASLEELESHLVVNKKLYHTYKQLLPRIPGLRLLEQDENHRPSHKSIVVELLDNWPLTREQTLTILSAENALARPYYSPLHKRRAVYPTISEALPVTERLANRFLIFPSGHHVTVSDIEKIINLLETIWHHGNYIAKKMKELGK